MFFTLRTDFSLTLTHRYIAELGDACLSLPLLSVPHMSNLKLLPNCRQPAAFLKPHVTLVGVEVAIAGVSDDIAFALYGPSALQGPKHSMRDLSCIDSCRLPFEVQTPLDCKTA